MSIGDGIAFAGFVFALSYWLTGGIKVSVDIGSIYNSASRNDKKESEVK